MSKSKRNGSEAKFYPKTMTTLESVLRQAKDYNDHFGAGIVLSSSTEARLNSIQPLFHAGRAEVAQKKVTYMMLTRQKEEAREQLLLHTSHFLQVFIMGSKRGKYNTGDRALFGMNTHSDALPSLKGDSNIQFIAERIVEGEATRIAQGKPAMVNPSGAEVEAVLNTFVHVSGLTSNANDAYNDAQRALRQLQKEARAVARKVWREVETHYNDGDRERMRKHAREWGVRYARKGGEKVVSGTVTDAQSGLPLAGVKMKFENGRNKTLTDKDGRFSFITNLLHKQTLIAVHKDYHQAEVVIELIEGEENKCAVTMSRTA